MTRFIHRPSPATVIASIALIVALGGTSIAAVNVVIPRNSVGSAQLKNNAVTSAKVRNGSLLRADFKAGQVPAGPPGAAGPAGPAGATGPTGPAGTTGGARAYGLVTPTGTLNASKSKGVASVSHPSAGTYCVTLATGIDAATTDVVATIDFSNSSTRNMNIERRDNSVCGGGNTVALQTSYANTVGAAGTQTLADAGFFFVVP